MAFIVVVTPRAKREAQYVGAWWRNHRPEAPLHFDEDFEELVASLTEHPDRGLAFSRGRRSILTARTGYRVVYRVRPRARRVEIISIER